MVKVKKVGKISEGRAKELLRSLGFKKIYLWEDAPNTYYPTHTHEGEEARLVLRGSVEIEVEGRKINLKEGELLILAPKTPHSARTQEGVLYVCGSK